eukprot:Plantae.Rhodophyta-Hildenbrandia_rubra.ctg9007.p1 GENE.Plantae.Rhodophyta-Hildenbrandia_rubra.ctg9007~~Plantae.Rhodophyta-Hildenbrandia_rubra.ctg9007.p1  ORF type:complete len:243 (-),score=68.83 Plantae.Rhodophyta-Hildenbrandia_rubra.ctg9007:1062-1790(-)
MGIFSRRKKKPEPAPQAPARVQRTVPVAAAPVPAPQSRVDGVTQEIKNRRDHIKLLEKNRDYKQKQIDDEVKKALMLKKKGDTKGALVCMKRKKRYEKAMLTISTQIETIEQGIDALESQVRNADVLKALEGTSAAMKKQQVDVNKADDVLQDMQDTIEKTEEVNMAFNQTQIGEQYDEDELLAELESEGVQKQLEEEVPDTVLPDVPTTVPKVSKVASKPQESEEERELRELERSMAATST